MGNLGRYLQKAMYPVGLRPFLEHTLEELVNSGVSGNAQLVLVVGHHDEQVRAYFGDSFGELRISYVQQETLTGTGDALRLAGTAIEGRGSVVAWQGDLFVSRELFRAVVRHEAETVVTLGRGHEDEPAVLRATVMDDFVTRVWEGAGPLVDIGLWKLNAALLPELNRVQAPGGEYRFLPNLQRLIDGGLEVGHVKSDEWVHLGGTLPTPEENVNAVVKRLTRGK